MGSEVCFHVWSAHCPFGHSVSHRVLIETRRERHRRGGRGSSHAAMSQGLQLSLDGGRTPRGVAPGDSRGSVACRPLDFGLPASRAVRESTSVVFSHHVCGVCHGGHRKWIRLPRVAGLVAGGEGRGCGGGEWEGGGHWGFLQGPGNGTSCWFEWGTWDHMTHSFHIC